MSLRIQKRLAASILNCGKNRVWIDPSETTNIAAANSRHVIRHLIKKNVITARQPALHSRARVRRNNESKSNGRHRGLGKRKGTSNARMPQKVLWIMRLRILRRCLRKLKDEKKIDSHIYRKLYKEAKGNVYKNKRVLIEAVHKLKAEKARNVAANEQLEARKVKQKRKY